MNNEIKGILEDVKRHLDYVEATKQASIRDNEMKAMYNYITNLQEENKIEKLKKDDFYNFTEIKMKDKPTTMMLLKIMSRHLKKINEIIDKINKLKEDK